MPDDGPAAAAEAQLPPNLEPRELASSTDADDEFLHAGLPEHRNGGPIGGVVHPTLVVEHATEPVGGLVRAERPEHVAQRGGRDRCGAGDLCLVDRT